MCIFCLFFVVCLGKKRCRDERDGREQVVTSGTGGRGEGGCLVSDEG